MMRIAVTDDWQRVARKCADWTTLQARADVQFFNEPFGSEDAAAAALAPFDAILVTRERTPFPRTLIDRLPALKMFGLTGVRAGLIDLAHLQAKDVTVCFTEGGPGVESTAELALALMLAAARRIPASEASLRAGRFQLDAPQGSVLAGRTLGLLGLGKIGARMARYGQALGMNVLAWSPHLDESRAAEAGATYVDKASLFERSDVVSLHLVLSPRTRHIVAAADLARMKPGAILVNTSRAPLVEESALLAAARSGHLVAALDVFEREPLPSGDPWLACPNTVLTPHLGYSVLEVYRDFYVQCVENALAWLDGKPIRLLPSLAPATPVA